MYQFVDLVYVDATRGWAYRNTKDRGYTTVTANVTAIAGDQILTNTTGGAFTVTLPASPVVGDEVVVIDARGTFATNNLTVARNGEPINTGTSDLILSTNGQAITLVYVDATRGWAYKTNTIDKQTTSAGAEQRWVDSDNTRFRYGLPEKVGGWQSPIKTSMVGIARQMHAFVDLTGNKYIVIGTDKFLLVYFDGALYDITPLSVSLGAGTMTTVASSADVTITLNSHGLVAGQIILMSSTTLPSGTGYSASDFDNKLFQVTSITDSNNFVITQSSAATGSAGPGGSITVTPYVTVGPQVQTIGYGWGTSTWGNGNWGEDSTGEGVVLEPGLWSLDNYGAVLVATIANGLTFTWNSTATDPLTIRASQSTSGFETTSNPPASRFTMVSPTT
jgi:hypothetical protein